MSATPIADYALLSDRHSAALVGRDGSVDWLCFPRFDSPSVFGRLLDDDAGHWSIRPIEPYRTSRRYLDRTMVLETTFETGQGTAVLTDTMLMGPDDGGHRLGVGAPHVLVRRLTGVAGAVTVELDYRPRPEYGLIRPLLSATDGGVTARGGAEWLVLTSPVPTALDAGSARATVTVAAGDTLLFALHRSTLEETPAHVWAQPELADRLAGTIAAWRSWSELHQAYEGPWRDLVHHSGRVLAALSFQPSGAIVAAATTSLPEQVGGERNWDYRYSWVRDASLTMEALWVAACPDEAADFFSFLTTAAPTLGTPGADGAGQWLQIMFGVGGEHDLSERTLPHLRGWRGSRPVRVGNAAWGQQQIDVYGELLGAAYRLADQLTGIDADTRQFLVACADAAAQRWREPDQGIWEVRGEPRHFLYSKVMCWVALDRAIALADQLRTGSDANGEAGVEPGVEPGGEPGGEPGAYPGGEPGAERVEWWRKVRDEIRETVLREGWSAQAGAFTQHFGGTELDAANLMMPIVGFLPADDPRMLATIDATERQLTDPHGLVYRYRAEGGVDGLAGGEGTFLLCTFWLAQALAMAGQVERARRVFMRAAGYVNEVGLLAEEVDPATRELLGNFPQAFSHIGLVNAAWAISQAALNQAGPAGTDREGDSHEGDRRVAREG